MLAACRISTDGAGLHIGCTIKAQFHSVSSGLSDHLGGGVAGGDVFYFKNLADNRFCFFFSHISSLCLFGVICVACDWKYNRSRIVKMDIVIQ
jgi:hypothetical protein